MSLECLKLDISNLVCTLNVKSIAITCVVSAVWGWVHSGSHNLFKVWEISANISETVKIEI